MVQVVYLTDHGNSKKDDKKLLPKSTSEALVKHKIVKIVKEEKTEK